MARKKKKKAPAKKPAARRRPTKRLTAWQKQRLREKAAAAEEARRLLLQLESDPDWAIVTGQEKIKTPADNQRERRALTRLTKQALLLLYPTWKVSVRYGRGTANNWVHIVLKTLGLPTELSIGEENRLRQQVEDVLVVLGVKYAQRYTDYGCGVDGYVPCISVSFE